MRGWPAALVMIVMLLAGSTLVVTEHYGWAWIPFLMVACMDNK